MINIEQIKQVLDGAPKGATHYVKDDYTYYKEDERTGLYLYDLTGNWLPYNNGRIYELTSSIEDLRTILAQHEEIERLRNPWISVEDELPKEGGKYICSSSYGIVTAIFAICEGFQDINTGNNEGMQDWSGVVFEVTHWMPLPQPPKEQSK